MENGNVQEMLNGLNSRRNYAAANVPEIYRIFCLEFVIDTGKQAFGYETYQSLLFMQYILKWKNNFATLTEQSYWNNFLQ